MYKILLAIIVSLCISGCYSEDGLLPRQERERIEMYRKAKKEAEKQLEDCDSKKDIVKLSGLERKGWIGSGFIIEYKGTQYLVSATHVFKADRAFLLQKCGKVVEYFPDTQFVMGDASIVNLKEKTFKNPFEVNTDFLRTLEARLLSGEKVKCTAYGYTPFGLKKTTGHILGLYVDKDTDGFFLITSNPVIGGMSGGVLLDEDGKAIGVVSAHVNGPDHWGLHTPLSDFVEKIDLIRSK